MSFVILAWVMLHSLDLLFLASLAPKTKRVVLICMLILINILSVLIILQLADWIDGTSNPIVVILTIVVFVCFDYYFIPSRKNFLKKIAFLRTQCSVCRSNVHYEYLSNDIVQCPICAQYFLVAHEKHTRGIIFEGFIIYFLRGFTDFTYRVIVKPIFLGLLHIFFPSKSGARVMLNAILGSAIGGIAVTILQIGMEGERVRMPVLIGVLIGFLIGLFEVRILKIRPKALSDVVILSTISVFLLWLGFIFWVSVLDVQMDTNARMLAISLITIFAGGLGATISYSILTFVVIGGIKGVLGWVIGSWIGSISGQWIDGVINSYGFVFHIQNTLEIIFGIIGALFGLLSEEIN